LVPSRSSGFKPLDCSGPRYLGWLECVFFVWSPLFVTGVNVNHRVLSVCGVVTGSCPDFLNIMKHSSSAFCRRKKILLSVHAVHDHYSPCL
jgi:hypothetical protein